MNNTDEKPTKIEAVQSIQKNLFQQIGRLCEEAEAELAALHNSREAQP